MKKLEIEFFGSDAEAIAQKLYTYLVDGGLEDQLIDHLSEETTQVEMRDWDNESLKVLFECKTKN